MDKSMVTKLAGFGVGSLIALGIGWSGLSHAADVDTNVTTVSRASVNIKSFEQTAPGVTEKVTVKTDEVILNLTGDSGDKPPKNQQLVLLNYCAAPEDFFALGVWDKDNDELVPGADVACLRREGPALYNDKQDKIYTTLDIDAEYFGMGEIDMSVELKSGKLKNNVDSNRPVCLKKFKTLAMGSYYDIGDGADGSRVLRKAGSIKTNGAVVDTLDGNVISACPPWGS